MTKDPVDNWSTLYGFDDQVHCYARDRSWFQTTSEARPQKM
jgi:hypothetical protein